MSKYRGLIISDIHVGAMDLDKLHNEYLRLFINHIKEIDKLDFVIITGDFFDHKFYLNDKEAIMAYLMLKELLLACKEKNAIVRIVYGTESHENNQYDILSLIKIYDNVEVIKTVKSEELLPDLHILYLPEEHILSKEEYYHDYFLEPKKYDFVFGHGVIREAMKEAALHMSNSKNSKRKSVPIFTSGELSRICSGQVFFGHYHIHTNIDDKVFYVGSFSRWQFGEEEDKGYYDITYNTKNHHSSLTYIKNTLCDTYQTIKYGYQSDIFDNEEIMNQTFQRMDNLIENNTFNHLRFIINIPSDAKNPESKINYLRERYKFNDNIKVETVNGYVEEQRQRKKEQIEEDNKKYNFIFDNNLPIEEKISRYIAVEYNKDIPAEKISGYILLGLNEIINKEK